jgi:CelD/BcsL family acetyltransferase involved in cellulose biosynthesis
MESATRIHNKPSLRRPTNYFRRMGRLACRDLTTVADITPHLDLFFDQHIGRWNGTNSPSLFLFERNRAFYRELTANVAGTGALLFSIVDLDDRPIAFHYGFDYGETMTWYKPSFDITRAAHSPGLVMVRHLIGRAIEQQRRELDFTVGDEPFKKRISNSSRRITKLLVYRDPVRFTVDSSRRVVVTAMKKLFESASGDGRSIQ